MKAMILVFSALFSLPSAYAEDVKQSIPAKGIKSIDVENGEGRITVEGVSGDTIELLITKHEFPKACTIEVKQVKDELEVELKAPGLFKTTRCHADVLVKAPLAMNIDAKTGSGDTTVSQITGDVEVKAGSGNIVIDGTPRELDAMVGSGSIQAKGLVGEADLKTGSGSITVEYKAVPAAGKLEVKTGSGNIALTVPKEAKITTDFVSGSGKLKNEVGDAPSGGFKVSVRSGSGDLHIKRAL